LVELEEWRLLGVDVYDGYMNMAIDEALMRLRSEGRCPNTVRLYRWKPPAVSIGYSQRAEKAANLGACKQLGIDVVRRMTGGGAVYHDYRWEITYSVVVDEDNPKIPKDLLQSYMVLSRGIVEGLRRLGLDAKMEPSLPLCSVLKPGKYGPLVDIVVNGRKICGSAQVRRWGVVLQHGTLLLDADFDLMFKALGIEDRAEEMRDKITTISGELGRKVDFNEVADALARGFEEALEVKLNRGWIGSEEMELASQLLREKYGQEWWNLQGAKREK